MKLIDAKTPVVTIFGKTWLLHVKGMLCTTPKENLAMIADTIAFDPKNGRKVIYDAEHALDGYKDDPEYAMATWKAAEKPARISVVLRDTTGAPVKWRRSSGGRKELSCRWASIPTTILAWLANAIAAVEQGATQ